MNSLREHLTQWLSLVGFEQDGITIIQQAAIIALIVILAWIADFVCRRIVVPSIKRIVNKTALIL